MSTLPIDPILPDLVAALRASGRAVLQAPPGAGKTTRVPLALLKADLTPGKIIMLEPRRLAARAAAERLAQQLGEQVGETIGYRMRGEAKSGPNTRIEVVTEGILTRMLQSDPELPEIGALLFDEFHERSLNADLGLALALEVCATLRDDLLLLVMSATLEAAPVAALMNDAPILTSQGRAFPVETRWLDRPLPKTTRIEHATADLITKAVQETTGGILVFLPGEGEIRRTERALNGRLPADCTVRPLFGAMPFKDQRAAIAPATSGRKVVLATSIAETSLTIEDIRCVVDAGRARRARFDPPSGMSRLVTERVTRAEATQRAGRAGRVAEGTCYRLWTKGEDGALAAFPPAEIEAADLSGLALELALWGTNETDLSFLTPPPPNALSEARDLLTLLGALDASARITQHGRALARVPLHPRLAHMLLTCGPDAAPLAALLSERDILRGAGSDLTLRLKALKGQATPGDLNHGARDRVRQETKRLSRLTKARANHTPAEQAALAYPDRIGLRRKGDSPRFVLSGGKGAIFDLSDPLGAHRLIVTTDLDGDTREAKIRQALPLSDAELRALFSDQIHWDDICDWSRRTRSVTARKQERFGALILDDRHWPDAPPEAIATAMLIGIRDFGLRFSGKSALLHARMALAHRTDKTLPDVAPETLLSTLEDWLLPHITGLRNIEDWKRFDLTPALKAMLDWSQTQRLDSLAPAHFKTPMGRNAPIDYSEDSPSIEARLQEMFGLTRHPTLGGTPLKLTLLSPAGRPLQVTTDLPGFWASSYEDVRKDMRGRYPRHPWPDDPTQAAPTLRAKPRGT